MATVVGECTAVLCRLCTRVFKRFGSPESINGNSPLSSSNMESSGKSVESKELRKKWINVIACKDFLPTTGHRVCYLHFRGWRKPT